MEHFPFLYIPGIVYPLAELFCLLYFFLHSDFLSLHSFLKIKEFSFLITYCLAGQVYVCRISFNLKLLLCEIILPSKYKQGYVNIN